MKTIAVGYDGSLNAQAALRWAAELAVAVDADLVIVHAVGILEGADLARRRPDADLALGLAESTGMKPGRSTWLLVDGHPGSVLPQLAGPPTGADLLVIGTRGSGSPSEALLGSTSLELAESAKMPLAIVPLPNS